MMLNGFSKIVADIAEISEQKQNARCVSKLNVPIFIKKISRFIKIPLASLNNENTIFL